MRVGAVITFCLILFTSTSAQQQYFPKGIFRDSPPIDSFVADWYSQQLAALEEPSLLEGSKKSSVESYRFLWLRAFDRPIAVRLDVRADGGAELTVKVADGTGGHKGGKLLEDSTRPLTRNQTTMFLTHLEKVGFWELSSYDHHRGFDGAEWIMEATRAGKYHLAVRWSPTSGPVYELGRMLLFGLAKLNIPKDRIY